MPLFEIGPRLRTTIAGNLVTSREVKLGHVDAASVILVSD
jgi:hypothetical protein